MSKDKIKILVIAGPTASGKTALSIEIAKRLDGEIVSCDSMQIYKEMIVGTAAPTECEMRGVPHHMIGICDPRVHYSAADYSRDAARTISDIASRGKYPIVCGGTGLYLDSLLKISEFADAHTDLKLRNELKEFAETHGNDALHNRLSEVDPVSAKNIHPNNVKRVVRALEIYETTGKPKSVIDKESIADNMKYDADIVTIDFLNRARLYERINERVDLMINSGLENEVRNLYDRGMLSDRTTAVQAIGYKEMLSYIKGEITLSDAVELIKKNTRNYAKRQMTWFRRYNSISVVPDTDSGEIKAPSLLADEVLRKLNI